MSFAFAANIPICHRCDRRAEHCAGGCACLIDGKDIVRHAEADYCPEQKFGGGKPAAWDDLPPADEPMAIVATLVPSQVKSGPELWGELHGRPAIAELATEAAWLERWSLALPCGDCRRHWQELLQATPPELGSRAAYFAWTVAIHNQVNRKLGKPELSLDQAIEIWNFRGEPRGVRGEEREKIGGR